MARKRANGEGQLRQRKNGLWELNVMVGWHEDGRRKTKSFYGQTQKEAKDKYEIFKQQAALGLNVEQNYSFSEWADIWYAGHKDAVSPTTYESYRYTLKILKDTFGRKKLKQIKPLDVEIFLKNIRAEGKGDSSLTKCRAMLFQIMHKAEANDFILKNPVRFAEKMKRIKRDSKKDAFTTDEIRLLLDNLPNDRIGNSIRLMLATGMRSQEILGLQPQHIAPDGSEIQIQQAVKLLKGTPYIGDPKSYESKRNVPVPELFRYAAIYLREQAGKFIWSGKIHGQPFNPRNFRKKFMDAIKSIEGVRPLTPHCCRHTYVTQMQALGVDVETIKTLAGHADTDMTEHYIHIQQESKRKAAEKFSEAFGI